MKALIDAKADVEAGNSKGEASIIPFYRDLKSVYTLDSKPITSKIEGFGLLFRSGCDINATDKKEWL
jgi:hypothetical protein